MNHDAGRRAQSVTIVVVVLSSAVIFLFRFFCWRDEVPDPSSRVIFLGLAEAVLLFTMASLKSLPIEQFIGILAAKQPTPGGGAAAAIGASIGSAAAAMSAVYTQRKTDIESGAAEKARSLLMALDVAPTLKAADDDAGAYADLQRTWKECDTMPPEEHGRWRFQHHY